MRLLTAPPLWRQLAEAALFAAAIKTAERLAEALVERALNPNTHNETDPTRSRTPPRARKRV